MRLIDADALKRKMQRVATEAWKMKITAKVETIMNQFIDFIEEQPTIEPERKTAKWIWSDEDASWKCENCDCVFEEIDWKPEYNFCPNCGAEMEEGD